MAENVGGQSSQQSDPGLEQVAAELAAMTSDAAAAALDRMSLGQAASVLSQMPLDKAAEVFRPSQDRVTPLLERLESDRAAFLVTRMNQVNPVWTAWLLGQWFSRELSANLLGAMAPATAVSLCGQLQPHETGTIIGRMNRDRAADLLSRMDFNRAYTVIRSMDPRQTVAPVVENMHPDRAAAIFNLDTGFAVLVLRHVSSAQVWAVLKRMERIQANMVREALHP